MISSIKSSSLWICFIDSSKKRYALKNFSTSKQTNVNTENINPRVKLALFNEKENISIISLQIKPIKNIVITENKEVKTMLIVPDNLAICTISLSKISVIKLIL
jgi:hypothetical protein